MSTIAYDRIGVGYDDTRKADPELAGRLIRLLGAKPGARVLDIGCGTGNYTAVLAQHGFSVTGVDPSERMLAEARAKSDAITWVSACAEDLPFDEASFEGAVATLTVHHWRDLERGFAEAARVVRAGGRLVVFTSAPEQTRGYWLHHYFPEMIERSATVLPAMDRMTKAALQAGFNLSHRLVYQVAPDLQDQFLYACKHRPERYLDPGFRKGISSFALAVSDHELEDGLFRLQQDIGSGAWQAVRDSHQSSLGDYVHLVFERDTSA